MTPPPTTDRGAAAGIAGGGPQEVDRPKASASLLDAVTDLRRDVAATSFPLPLPGVEVAEARRRQLLDQLDDHLLPRLRELSAPAVVVVAGSTGAGKSTLVNSLLGEEVSAAGVLRPTTRRPLLAHHPLDAPFLVDHPLLAIVDVVEREVVPRGLALIDAPDLDSLLATNRSTAHRLLEAADLWLFVTTAARYGDALPWEVLDRAVERGTSMAMVLNRVPEQALVTVRGDLMARLRARGMSAVPLFLVPDAGPHEGLLAPAVVAPMLRWLTMVAGPDRARSVIARTQRGSLAALRPWVDDLAEAVQAQVDAREALEKVVAEAVAQPAVRASAAVAAGGVVDGPVRARWTEVTGGDGAFGGRWTTRRRRAARASAAGLVATDLRAALEVSLRSARHSGAEAVTVALESTTAAGADGVLKAVAELDGGHGDHGAHRAALPAVPRPAPSPEESAQQWWTRSVEALAALGGSADRRAARRVERLVTAVGADGAATLVALGAAGLDGPRTLLGRALGEEQAGRLLTTLTEDLCRRAAEQARAGAEPAEAVLTSEDLADDAASRLRLRRAVLKGLT